MHVAPRPVNDTPVVRHEANAAAAAVAIQDSFRRSMQRRRAAMGAGQVGAANARAGRRPAAYPGAAARREISAETPRNVVQKAKAELVFAPRKGIAVGFDARARPRAGLPSHAAVYANGYYKK